MTFFTRTRITILKYIITATALILVILNLPAQNSFENNYTPLVHGDTAYRIEICMHLKNRYAFLVDSLSRNANKEKKKLCKDIFDSRYEVAKNGFADDDFLWGDSLTAYLQVVMNRLAAANKDILGKKYLTINRTGSPNAYSIGDDVLFFNLGLLSRVRNEAEIAFVLGHELAHDKFNHVTKKVIKRIATATDKDVKIQLETASKSEYNNYHKVQQLYKGLLFDFNKHGRDHESEADSQSVIWMIKAGYNPDYAVTNLELLDSIDEEKYTEPINYKKIFSNSDFVFKDEWLKGEGFIGGFKSKKELLDEDNDTIKTHPDCKKREEAVKKLFKNEVIKNPLGNKFLKDNVNIRADFEIIQYDYEEKQFGRSLYNTLHLIQRFPNNVYLKAMIGKNLYFLYKALKDHDFSKYTDLPNPYFSDHYNEFLNFINNLRSSEFNALATSYIKKNQSAFKDAQFEFASILCLSMTPEKTSVETLINDYAHQFPGTAEAKYLKENLLLLNNPKKTKK